MSTFIDYPAQVLPLVRSTIASRPQFAWIKPSWIMAFIQIESSFQPLVVNNTGRMDGLMQVIPGTAAQMQRIYGLGTLLPQTDPTTSVLCGTCYVDYAARQLVAAWGAPIPLSAAVESYNEGYGAAEKGQQVPRYWANWSAAQILFSSDDVSAAPALGFLRAAHENQRDLGSGLFNQLIA
jgi:soluble lytic murein transglycosylase-like protein